MDPPTYPFEETSFMNGPLVEISKKETVECVDSTFKHERKMGLKNQSYNKQRFLLKLQNCYQS